MEKLKDYIIIGLFVIISVIFLLKGCSNPFPNLDVTPEKPKTEMHSDTVFTKEIVIKFKDIHHTKLDHDTIYLLDTTKLDINDLMYTRIYNDSISDSTLSIYSRAKVDGVLNQLSISYKMHPKPFLITNNTTITLPPKEVIKTPKIALYSGLSLLGSKTSFDIAPFVNINFKNKSLLYSYHILDNQHQIGVSLKIFSSKK